MQNKKNALLATVYLGIFMALFAVITTMFSTILPKITALYTLTLGQVSVFTVEMELTTLRFPFSIS